MLAFALRMCVRDWRAGELRVLALALVVAVASITSVGFFADRVRLALEREAHQLLGADLVLRADHPWPQDVRAQIRRSGLALAENITFFSMAQRADKTQLVSIKAVSPGYPLRGKLRVAPRLNAPDAETDRIPARGTVWIDDRLAADLGLTGRLDGGATIELGKAKFTVGEILTMEPDRGVSFFNIAPRLMMNLADVPATGLVQTGSRVSYTLLAAGRPAAVDAVERWLTPRLRRGEHLRSLANARPELRAVLERAQKFIGLTAMLAVILAAVAVSLAARRFTQRHLDGYAVMRCLGATQARLLLLSFGEFLVLGALACAAGCVAGYLAQMGIAVLVAGLIAVPLPQPSALPAVHGFAVGIGLLLGFALPPLQQLKGVPALRVIRREIGAPREGALFAYALGVATIAALLLWQAGEVRLGLIVLGGFVAALAVFGLAALGTLAVVRRAVRGGALQGRRATWRYGLAKLARRARQNIVQILALSLGLAAILLLTFTRADLLATWQAKVPPDAPNRFVINIQPQQRAPLAAFLRANGIAVPYVYPMVRGRFVAKNGVPVDVSRFDAHGRRLAERDFNLSYMTSVPAYNHIVEGRPFSGADLRRGGLSVEQGIAKTLGWKVGDRLTWQVAGRRFTAPVTSIRKLDWDSMQVNFFVIASPRLLEGAPTSYITALYLPSARASIATQLSQRFPNLTIIDLSAVLKQLKSMLDQVVRAVQFVFLFALGAGVLVLYSALLATEDERSLEAAVMRALGATRAQVLGAQRAEFAALGLIAGLLASAAAVAVGYAVASFVFQFPYHFDPWIWIAGPVLGLACVLVNTLAAARTLVREPPLAVLREL